MAEAEPRSSQVGPTLVVGPSPHLRAMGPATPRLMLDVLLALVPVLAMALYVFGWPAAQQVSLAVAGCLAAEAAFTRCRGRTAPLGDLSAAVTGVILGLSLPWSAPWYVPVIGAAVAIGIGKVVFGGLGQNLFNPAMVGRAFVMSAFPAAMGAAAYVRAGGAVDAITQATPLSAAREASAKLPELWPLFVGTVNGSLGEVSAVACLVGGLYLCLRRTASWEIPVSLLAAAAATVAVLNGIHPGLTPSPAYHLFSGALMFGAFFIATDPVTSPLASRGKAVFGALIGVLVILIRVLGGYPEGVMFAVLFANGLVPLINRWTVPVPVGGRPARRT